jgi:hypothetical protein
MEALGDFDREIACDPKRTSSISNKRRYPEAREKIPKLFPVN